MKTLTLAALLVLVELLLTFMFTVWMCSAWGHSTALALLNAYCAGYSAVRLYEAGRAFATAVSK